MNKKYDTMIERRLKRLKNMRLRRVGDVERDAFSDDTSTSSVDGEADAAVHEDVGDGNVGDVDVGDVDVGDGDVDGDVDGVNGDAHAGVDDNVDAEDGGVDEAKVSEGPDDSATANVTQDAKAEPGTVTVAVPSAALSKLAQKARRKVRRCVSQVCELPALSSVAVFADPLGKAHPHAVAVRQVDAEAKQRRAGRPAEHKRC